MGGLALADQASLWARRRRGAGFWASVSVAISSLTNGGKEMVSLVLLRCVPRQVRKMVRRMRASSVLKVFESVMVRLLFCDGKNRVGTERRRFGGLHPEDRNGVEDPACRVAGFGPAA